VKDNKCCRLTHPSFVRFYGVGTTQKELPFQQHGDLMSFLQHNNGLPAAQVNSIVRTIAEGLLFLHSQKIPLVLYHLNPRDILITGTGTAKIANF
jgi:serine/threonine protein kinase